MLVAATLTDGVSRREAVAETVVVDETDAEIDRGNDTEPVPVNDVETDDEIVAVDDAIRESESETLKVLVGTGDREADIDNVALSIMLSECESDVDVLPGRVVVKLAVRGTEADIDSGTVDEPEEDALPLPLLLLDELRV